MCHSASVNDTMALAWCDKLPWQHLQRYVTDFSPRHVTLSLRHVADFVVYAKSRHVLLRRATERFTQRNVIFHNVMYFVAPL